MDVIKPKGPLFDIKRFKPQLKQVLQDIQTDGTKMMSDYPTQRLTKTGYKRTMTLARSWAQADRKGVRETGDGLEAEVGSNANIAPYNKYVEGKADTQVPMFRDAGWQNVDDLIELAGKRLEKDIAQVIKEAT